MSANRLIAASLGASLSKPSGLRWTVARMISTNSLAAFTQEVARTRPATEARAMAPTGRTEAAGGVQQVAQRKLEAVPPEPSRPLPRGSLLDLRV